MLTLFSKQINKAIDECKSSAVIAKQFVGNIEAKKWSFKKKDKLKAYQTDNDEDDEYISWGSDFDESCSDDDEGQSLSSSTCCGNQFNECKSISPATIHRRIRRKIVRPTDEPPPPPIPQSPKPVSPSKLSFTDRLDELNLDDLNEVLGVQLSSDPEDNDDLNENEYQTASVSHPSTPPLPPKRTTKSAPLTTGKGEDVRNENQNAEEEEEETDSDEKKRNDRSSPPTVPANQINIKQLTNLTSTTTNSSQQLQRQSVESECHNQERFTSQMGLLSAKMSKNNDDDHSDYLFNKSNNNDHSDNYINNKYERNKKADSDQHKEPTSTVTPIGSGIEIENTLEDEDFGDYETPLSFNYPIAHINPMNGNNHCLNRTNGNPRKVIGNGTHRAHGSSGSTASDSSSSACSSSSSTTSSSCYTQMISRSSSVASGSFVPDSGFSDCAGISPYPLSPPPPFDDNFCLSCRKLMKSVGSTPNLNSIRLSSSTSASSSCSSSSTASSSNPRSDHSYPQVTSKIPPPSTATTTTPIAAITTTKGLLSSMKDQTNNLTTGSPGNMTSFDNNDHQNLSPNHNYHLNQFHHQPPPHHQHQPNQQSRSHSQSTSNLALLIVDRPKLPRYKPDYGGNTNHNSSPTNHNNNSSHHNNSPHNNNSTGMNLKAEIAAKFAEKAAFAKKIINSRPSFKPFGAIYATGKSFGFSSSSSSHHHHHPSTPLLNNNNNPNTNNNNKNNNSHVNRSGSTCNLAQRPLPPLPDDVMPIEKYSWFHGLERDSAVAVLENLGTDGSYLVRPSKRAGHTNPMTLSILNEGKVFHLNIRRRSDGLYCLGKEKDKERTFASVPALIRFHQKEPILLTTKGESAGITKLMVTPISFSSTINPSSSSSSNQLSTLSST